MRLRRKDGYFTVWASVVAGLVMILMVLTFIPLNNSSRLVRERFSYLDDFLQEQIKAERQLAAGGELEP